MSTVLYLYTIAVLEMSTAFSSGKQSMLFGAQMSTDFYIRKKADAHAGVRRFYTQHCKIFTNYT